MAPRGPIATKRLGVKDGGVLSFTLIVITNSKESRFTDTHPNTYGPWTRYRCSFRTNLEHQSDPLLQFYGTLSPPSPRRTDGVWCDPPNVFFSRTPPLPQFFLRHTRTTPELRAECLVTTWAGRSRHWRTLRHSTLTPFLQPPLHPGVNPRDPSLTSKNPSTSPVKVPSIRPSRPGPT